MLVSKYELSIRHPSSDLCQQREDQKYRYLETKNSETGKAMKTTGYSCPITAVYSFKYIGMVLLAPDDDWTAVIRNLHRAWYKLARLS